MELKPTILVLCGSAISVLQDAGAIRECGEEHGWLTYRTYLHVGERAVDTARQEPPSEYLSRRGWWITP